MWTWDGPPVQYGPLPAPDGGPSRKRPRSQTATGSAVPVLPPIASGAGDASASTAMGPTTHTEAAGAPASSTVVRTVTGRHTIASGRVVAPTLPAPSACSHPLRLAPLLSAAALLLIPISASADKIRGTCARFLRAIAWLGIALGAVTGPVIAAYVVLRCAPPVDTDLPPDWGIVSPVTAAGDIDTLRRAARLGLEGMASLLPALLDPIVSALLVAIGGRMKRLKTAKKPILYSEVAAFFTKVAAMPNATPIMIRDAFALVLGFHFAMRASELLNLRGGDLRVVDGGNAIQLRFVNVKNRRSIFSTHDPFVVTASGKLLVDAYKLFNSRVGFRDDLYIFHHLRGTTEKQLSRDWLSGVVAAAAPARTPHSLRVGAATELYAAGVPINDIMALGRWTSTAALLYVLGTMEDTIAATQAMGGGGLRITSDGLRRATKGSIPRDAIATADSARWAAACHATA